MRSIKEKAVKNFLNQVIQEAKEDLSINQNDKWAQAKLNKALNFNLNDLQSAIEWSYELGFSSNKNDADFLEDWNY